MQDLTEDRIGFEEPSNIPKVIFDQLGDIIITAQPKNSPPYRGIGKRSYIQLSVRSLNLGIEFYVERVVPPTPGKPDLGFTLDDVEKNQGVAIYDILERGEGDKLKRFSGEVISLQEFLDRYITSDTTRQILILCMDELDEDSMLQETFFNQLNDIWSDRKINSKEIYKAHTC